MTVIETAEVPGRIDRPLAVVTGAWQGAGRAAALLERNGHRVHCVATAGDLSVLADREVVDVAVVPAELLQSHDPGAATVMALGVGDVYAVHTDGADVAAMWRSHRHGAVPWVLDPGCGLPAIAPAGAFGGELVLDALHEDLQGRHAAACAMLASVRDPRVLVEVVDVLVGAGAAAIERLRNRCRYPVPSELLETHLPAHVGTLDGAEFALWWSMVETVVFRASGLRLPQQTQLVERPFAVASAAFHATGTIVRFTARRQWRRPDDLLADLAAGE